MYKIPPYIGLWLLQMFGILFPMVIYQSFFQRKFINKCTQKKILTFLCGISIFICMTFPVSINEDYLLDFRFIPLIIGFVFGGFRVGLILSILLIGYRFEIGGAGIYLGGLWMTIILVVAFRFILSRTENMNSKWRAVYPYLLLTLSLIIYAFGTQFIDDYQYSETKLIQWVWFSILNYLTFWMVMYLQNSIEVMEKTTNKMIHFEKSHTVNQLLISISQQFLLPLQSSKEIIYSIQEEPLMESHADALQKMVKELNQVEKSLNQYLSIMDVKQETEGEWNFVRELEDIIQLMSLYAEMNQVNLVYISTAQREVSIKGEHAMIRFALVNILKNAIEACEPTGHVNISLHEMLKEVYIVIEDNGGGIPAHISTQNNRPFSDMRENGTDLGLASTFKIAESLGGRVEVKSKPNEGTTFSLYFPKWAIS